MIFKNELRYFLHISALEYFKQHQKYLFVQYLKDSHEMIWDQGF